MKRIYFIKALAPLAALSDAGIHSDQLYAVGTMATMFRVGNSLKTAQAALQTLAARGVETDEIVYAVDECSDGHIIPMVDRSLARVLLEGKPRCAYRLLTYVPLGIGVNPRAVAYNVGMDVLTLPPTSVTRAYTEYRAKLPAYSEYVGCLVRAAAFVTSIMPPLEMPKRDEFFIRVAVKDGEPELTRQYALQYFKVVASKIREAYLKELGSLPDTPGLAVELKTISHLITSTANNTRKVVTLTALLEVYSLYILNVFASAPHAYPPAEDVFVATAANEGWIFDHEGNRLI